MKLKTNEAKSLPASMRSFGRGFTLIEIMVSVSIFVIVALIVTSTVITTSETNRKAQAIKVAIDNLSFALDSMSLKIRQGNTFRCLTSDTDPVVNGTISVPQSANNCDGSGAGIGIAFLVPDIAGGTKKIVYLFDETDPSSGKLRYCNADNGAPCTLVDITDSSLVDISALKFYVWNARSLPSEPPRPQGRPRIAVSIAGATKDPKTKTEFYLQTTASGK